MKEPKIVSDPAILGGKPVISGTRIAVSTILDFIAAGLSIEDVLREYPGLTKKDVQAAISFASERIRRETIHPLIAKNGRMIFPTI